MIVSDKEFNEMSPEARQKYHKWCWFKGYGNCDLCAIYLRGVNGNKHKESPVLCEEPRAEH